MSSVTVCCISCNDLCVFVVQCDSWRGGGGGGGGYAFVCMCGYTIKGRSVFLLVFVFL